MSEILINPPLLTQTASDLRNRAKRLQAALDAVESEMRSLSGKFEGKRAEELQARYNKMRQQIQRFKPLIDHFANDLDQAAIRFTKADQ